MDRLCLRRLLALLLCLCLMPAMALADDAVTRSDFVLDLTLNADAFPRDGAAHYADWETFLSKLSLRGVIDTQNFLQTYDRAYFSGGLYLNDVCQLPFEYDQYYSFRYVRSPALGGASVHMQMENFFEFMLKGHYFMGLPTELIAVLLYPEAAYELGTEYLAPLENTLGGTDERTLSYNELYALAVSLSDIANDEWFYNKVYFFVTCLLVDLGMSYATMDKLCCVEDWLAFIDPGQQGMTIAKSGEELHYVVGEKTLLTRALDGSALSLSFPDAEGYELRIDYQNAGGALSLTLGVTLEGEDRLSLALALDGLGDALSGQGTATVAFGGAALEERDKATTQTFAYRYSRTAAELPYAMTLTIDWLHPQTNAAAITLSYSANMESLPPETLIDRPYDDQNDILSMNGWTLEELQERFTRPLALSAIPFVVEMPGGVLGDIVGFMYQTGMLAFLGLE